MAIRGLLSILLGQVCLPLCDYVAEFMSELSFGLAFIFSGSGSGGRLALRCLLALRASTATPKHILIEAWVLGSRSFFPL
jgi:hypothetical protein